MRKPADEPRMMRIPDTARPVAGDDQHMTVIGPEGCEYDFWVGSNIDESVVRHSRLIAALREDVLRDVARADLPRRLRWLVGHRRMLALVYRLRPSWAPVLVYGVDGDVTVGMVRRRDGTMLALPS